MTIDLPASVKKVLALLNNSGYYAYAVGGCVRDAIIGTAPEDWDITTNALPNQIKEVFLKYIVIETGIKHGTVTVLIDNNSFEITTYRIDGEYTDNRHPSKVVFTDNLKEDIKRRDFTINGICCDIKGNIIDYFDGKGDIADKTIKAIGVPKDRFNEDALRIMRAIRFSSVLGFKIENNTKQCVHSLKHLLKNVSAERIQSELNKTLLGKNFENTAEEFSDVIFEIIPELKSEYNFEQHNPHHKYNVWIHTIKAIEASDKNLYVRLALLFHDCGKPNTFTMKSDGIGHFYGHAQQSAELARQALNRLKYDNKTKHMVLTLVKYHDTQIIPENKYVKRFISKVGEEAFLLLLKVKYGDISGQGTFIEDKKNTLERLYNVYLDIKTKDECMSLKSLAVNGKDLINIGIIDGSTIGDVLNSLLKSVIDEKLNNDKASLLEEAKRLVK